MGYNRKERLKIASKLGKQKNRPTNNTISWRLSKLIYVLVLFLFFKTIILENLQNKSQKEAETLHEHEEFKTSGRRYDTPAEETMETTEPEVQVDEVQNYDQSLFNIQKNSHNKV